MDLDVGRYESSDRAVNEDFYKKEDCGLIFTTRLSGLLSSEK